MEISTGLSAKGLLSLEHVIFFHNQLQIFPAVSATVGIDQFYLFIIHIFLLVKKAIYGTTKIIPILSFCG